MNKEEQKLALALLKDFVWFAIAQEKAGVVDGSADPTILVHSAIGLLNKHAPLWNHDDFALSA